MSIIFGYACISELHPQLKTGSTSTLTYINRLPLEQRGDYLRVKARANLKALGQLLRRNAQSDIRAYRLPDSLLPMADLDYYNINEFESQLRECGEIANRFDMHLSFHPSQFFVLNSATPHVVQNTVKNLDIFAQILELMQLKNHPVLLTHVGARSTYRTQDLACDAFCQNYRLLSPIAQQYLCVENDQTAHSIDSCFYIHQHIGIPVVFDSAHYMKKPVANMSLTNAIESSLCTWNGRTPKLHLSSERDDDGRHAHADYIKLDDYSEMVRSIQSLQWRQQRELGEIKVQDVIIMIEAKKKDAALVKLRGG